MPSTGYINWHNLLNTPKIKIQKIQIPPFKFPTFPNQATKKKFEVPTIQHIYKKKIKKRKRRRRGPYLARKRRERAWRRRKRRWQRRRRACGCKNLHWLLGKRPNCGACWRLYPSRAVAEAFGRIWSGERRSVVDGGRRMARGGRNGLVEEWRKTQTNTGSYEWPLLQGQISPTCRLAPFSFFFFF